MKNVLPNSFEFLIHQFNSLNRELIYELWINSSIQPVSESYAQRFYHWGHAGVREIFRQQTLGCPLLFPISFSRSMYPELEILSVQKPPIDENQNRKAWQANHAAVDLLFIISTEKPSQFFRLNLESAEIQNGAFEVKVEIITQAILLQ